MGYFQDMGGKISDYTRPRLSGLDVKAAETLGLGQRKVPDQIGNIDESAFTDTSRSDAFRRELERQKADVGGREFERAFAANLGDASTRSAETMSAAKFDREPQREFRQGQQDLVAALQQQAAGQGPSLAAMQLDDARNQQIETAMALAASQRGLGAGQGLRSITQQTQEAGQFAAREAARGRIAEQLAARQQLGGALQSARGQDIGIAGMEADLQQQAAMANQAAMNQAGAQNMAAQNQFALQDAGFQQQANLQNQQAALQFQAQQDAARAGLTGQLGQVGNLEQQRLMDLERLKFQEALAREQGAASAYQATQAARQNMFSGLVQGAATAAKMAGGPAGGAGAAAGGA